MNFLNKVLGSAGLLRREDLAIHLATLEHVVTSTRERGLEPDRGAVVMLFEYAQATGIPTPVVQEAPTEIAVKTAMAKTIREEKIPHITEDLRIDVANLHALIAATERHAATSITNYEVYAGQAEARAEVVKEILALIS